ncbi:MAG TPA: DCC1-like thiol-disulfide oxidoreductase family protein [Gemmatimonadales bacterium]|nr:DCC1-like thiol-disulfide oxidoreductase family protein [Gemmatimonadales bacterium]
MSGGGEGRRGGPVFYYDGDCGVCTRSVRLVLRRDRRRTLRFASLRGPIAEELFTRHPGLRGVDSMLWVEPRAAASGGGERVLVRSDAALALARYLGGWWRLFEVFRLVPRRLRDLGYDWFARNRLRFFGPAEECTLPTPEQRSRFLDLG